MTGPSADKNGDSDDIGPAIADDGSGEFRLDVRQLAGLVSDQAVWLLDPDGQVVEWSAAAQELTGYEDAEIVDSHYRQLFPTDRRESGHPERLLERARTEGRAEDEGWRLRSDGSRLWGREVVAPLRAGDLEDDGTVDVELGGETAATEPTDGDGNADADGEFVGYASLLHDRTAERERERELREEKAFTESVFAAQPDVVYAFDGEGNYLKWNDRVPEVTGYTESELVEMGPLEFIAPDHRERIGDAIQRILEEDERVAVEADLLTKDGTRIPHEFNSARITDEDGTVLGFTGVARDVSDRKTRERALREEKALTESIFAAQPDLLYAYDTDGKLIHWNERLEEVSGRDSEALEGMNPLDFIAPPDREHIAAAIDRILAEGDRVTAEGRIVTADGEYVPYEFNSARITDEDGAVLGFTGVGRDISDRKARERELERLERLNATIRRIDETMVAAESRAEIERAIVETFGAADVYRFAAIGRVDAGAGAGVGATSDRTLWDWEWEWDLQASVGIDDATAETIPLYVDPPTPEQSVLETGAVECYHDLRESEIGAWRADAREHDYGSVAVVPIAASGRTYGVFVVAAEEPTAFTDREQEILQEFGGTIGHAINAMAVRRLLYQDTLVELEFESTDRRGVCADLSRETESRVSLDHVLSLTDERFVYYVTVSGADPETVRDWTAAYDAVDEARRIETDGDESHWELAVEGPTITGLLADCGARIRSQAVDDGDSTTVVQASPDVDVRELVDAVTAAYPDLKLSSKRTAERPVETSGDFRRRVREEVTAKQRTALEAAYYAGYFEWPTRRSDAGEVADRLGIARQTFHQHLRVALGKLLGAYFEGTTDGESGGSVP